MPQDITEKLKYVLPHLSPWGRYYLTSVLAAPHRLPRGEWEKIIEKVYDQVKDEDTKGGSDREPR